MNNTDSIMIEMLARIQKLEYRVSELEKKNSLNDVSKNEDFTTIKKYKSLANYLENCGKESVKLSFSEIEKILSFPLPDSAKYRPFWANSETHSFASSWLSVGYKADVDMDKKEVVFGTKEFFEKSKIKQKKFELNGVKYSIEIGYYDKRTFRLNKIINEEYVDLEGNQKRFIVAKLKELIEENPNLDITDEEKGYIKNYGPGHTQGQNSNKLAKMLYRLLPEK